MSIFEFHYHELDSAIDERIERSNNIRDEWGTKIFDSEGRLRSSEDFPLEPYTLLGIIQYQQEQITELIDSYAFTNTIITNSKIDSSMLESLLERVKDVEKYKTLIDVLAIRVSELEKEVEKL